MREDAVELAAMSWFELAGWRSVPGADLAPGGAMGARSSYAQALLEPELRSALASLNPHATPGMIDQGVRAVLSVPSQDLLTNNAAFHAQLATGVRVETVENGERKWVGLRLLDRENPDNNRLLVANQFVFDNDRRERIRADLVAFVNGIPVALLELKSHRTRPRRSRARIRSFKITRRQDPNCCASTRCSSSATACRRGSAR